MLTVDIHTHRPAEGVTALRTAGIHPWQADECTADSAERLREVLGDPLLTAQAIGETGLDFACGTGREAQERLFRAHLELAVQMRLPVVIHCVRAFEQVMKILDGYAPPAVLFHGFIGSVEQARRAAGRGYYLSFGVRSLRSPRSVEAMRTVPAELFFVETDDDDTPVDEVCRMAAELLNTDAETLADRIGRNYKRFCDNGQLA